MTQTRKRLTGILRAVPLSASMAALALMVGTSTPEPAAAQSGFNNRDVCVQLERELARMQRPAPAPDRDIMVEVQRAERAMHAAYRRAQQTGCFQRGFLIFQPQVPRACRRLESDYYRAKDTYEQLAARAGGRGQAQGSRRQRDRIISALAANRCGPQYEQYARARRGVGDVMSLFFGGGALIEPQAPGGGGYRTLCVRTCDGFYFPISFSTYPEFFARDAAACRAACPAAEAQLFAYPNPGAQPEDAESPQGVRLKDMPNAFRYRNELVPDCTCKAKQDLVANADGPASPIRASFGPQGTAQASGPISHISELAMAPVPPIKPGPFDIQDVENPSGPVEIDPADTTRTADNREVTSPATGNRPVRVIGPEFFVAQ
jgi:hypothetical protein